MRELSPATQELKDADTWHPEYLLFAPALGFAVSLGAASITHSGNFSWRYLTIPVLSQEDEPDFEAGGSTAASANPLQTNFEPRYLTQGEVETTVPLGGGLGSVGSLRITIVEDGIGNSLRSIYNKRERLEGQQISYSLLFRGLRYSERVPLFTGVIDHPTWQHETGELQAVDSTLPADKLLPQKLLNKTDYPNLPEENLNRPAPIWYGRGHVARLRLVPLILINAVDFQHYLVAGHACVGIGTSLAVWPSGTRDESLLFTKTDPGDISPLGTDRVVLTRPIAGQFFQSGPIPLLAGRHTQATFPENVLDGNMATVATLRTDGQVETETGDGIAALSTYSSLAVPNGANTVKLVIGNYRRGALSAATVVGVVYLNRMKEDGNVTDEALWTSPDLRRVSSPITQRFTISGITIDGTYRLEAYLLVRNEGTLGTINDIFTIGELTFELGYVPQSALDQVFLAPGDGNQVFGRADTEGTVTGTPGHIIQNPADVIRSICVQEGQLAIDGDSFTAVRQATVGQVFDGGLGTGWSVERQQLRDTVHEMAVQADCYLFPKGNGQLKLVRTAATNPVHELNQRNILVVNPEDSPSEYTTSVQVRLSNIDEVANTFRLHYAWHAGRQTYAELAEATPTASTHSTLASTMIELCQDSLTRYRERPPWEYEARWIYDRTTAEALLEARVRTFSTQWVYMSCETTLAALHVECGDWVTVTHPHLPEIVQGADFCVLGVRHLAQRGTILLELAAPGLPTFSYLRIKTQSGDIKYWWVNLSDGNRLGYGASIPSIFARRARDITPPPLPYYVRYVDSNGITWYVIPHASTAAPTAQNTLPSVGTEYPGPLLLRASTNTNHQMIVSTGGSVRFTPT